MKIELKNLKICKTSELTNGMCPNVLLGFCLQPCGIKFRTGLPDRSLWKYLNLLDLSLWINMEIYRQIKVNIYLMNKCIKYWTHKWMTKEVKC